MCNTERKLLFSVTKKDLVLSWYKSGGSGGQKKNKTANACRIQHPDSGAMVTASERRERQRNLRAALQRLVKHPKFRVWHAKKIAEIEEGCTIEERVKEQMNEQNLIIEAKKGKNWERMN